MSYLIEKDGERQFVTDLGGYEDWTLLGEGDACRPIEDGAFDGKRWAVPLDLLKARKWEAIKARRDATRYGGCMTAKGRIDSDPESQRKVGGAVSMAMMLGDRFVIEWTMFDNNSATFNAAEMEAAGIALGMFESECHAIGRELRDAIETAETAEQLDAISWPTEA